MMTALIKQMGNILHLYYNICMLYSFAGHRSVVLMQPCILLYYNYNAYMYSVVR